jgi:protocatechuate 3,4-dioxygenase, beta subunit
MRVGSRNGINRRAFRCSRVVFALVVFLAAGALLASGAGALGPCAQATSVATLAGPEEPGERLVVTGTVFAPDGVAPAAGVFLYVYHTDATGHYNRERGDPPRLRGWMKTGPDGKYEYRTIRPAPYPGRTIAAHVHTQLWGGGYPAQWNADLLFEGDPLITARERDESDRVGRFAFIRPSRKDDHGVRHVAHDLRLKTAGTRFSANILHGMEPCGVKPQS